MKKHIKLNLLLGAILFLFTHSISAQELGEDHVYVNGNCGMCKSTIEKAAMNSGGVIHASWDSNTKSLNLIYDEDKFDMDATLMNIGNVGYDNETYITNQEVYDKLPLCCQYRSTSDVDVEKFHKANDTGERSNAYIRGVIYDLPASGTRQSLPGVNIYYEGTEIGVTTDINGLFSIPLRGNKKETIVISYLGYQNDTIKINSNDWIEVTMNEGLLMNEIVIRHRKKTTEYSFINPIKVESITQGELEKAACCNLSESFTTNASVDESATDAVTGTRQIQLLGLASPYVQITLENVPYIRGLSAISGFNLVPGPWISGMQLNTGAGSVTDGFEAMTGQINVQYKDPTSNERAFVNLYANKSGAMESNLIYRIKQSERVNTSILMHTKYRDLERDNNNDGFLDNPTTKHLFLSNKWKFKLSETWNSRVLINASTREEQSGQYKLELSSPWKVKRNERKIDAYIKSGKRFTQKKKTSIGFIGFGSYHEQQARYGNTDYEARHRNLYSNIIFESIVGSTDHKYRVGFSFLSDNMEETVNDKTYKRDEQVVGAHAEYTYAYDTKFTAVVGIRGDIHNNYGFFFTPRLHLRYMPIEKLVFRASIGQGRRTASIFAENPGVFVSSRAIKIESMDNDKDPYGLERESSWTMGGNISYGWTIFGKETLLSSDYYYTTFEEQVIFDWDTPKEVSIYMLEGKSFSKSFKTQWDIELYKNFDLRLAYRYNDVQTDYKSGRREKPLNSKHRFFANFGYKTDKLWKYDLTLNRQGSKRLPYTASNPEAYRLLERSPVYYTIAAQISKTIKDWEFYIGGENIGNYKQTNPILSADNPWDPHFDASMVWGPVFGSNYYVGIRYTLKDK